MTSPRFRRLGVVAFMSACATLSAGCAVEAPSQEPGTVAPEVRPGTVTDESTGLGTGVVGGLTGALGICTPLTCCFPTGAEWGNNAFENGLRALGCTMPAACTQKDGR